MSSGGYDKSRLNASASLEAIPFGADFSRDLVVGIQSITYDTLGSSPLLSTGIYAFIDSMVTAMYLPLTVCQAFEEAFNLTWNTTAGLYLLSKEQHAVLLAQNPTLTFTIGLQANTGGQTVDVRLPYAAFDLNIRQPYVADSTRYFPLQRAQNESQYTLGRVFLQEAYIVADYDRQQFRIGQALFPSTEAEQDLVVLEPPGNGTSAAPPGTPSAQRSSMSPGVLAGIAGGGVLVVTLTVVASLLWLRRRMEPSPRAVGSSLSVEEISRRDDPQDIPAEMAVEGTAIHEIGSGGGPIIELAFEANSPGQELPANNAAQEIDGQEMVGPGPAELDVCG